MRSNALRNQSIITDGCNYRGWTYYHARQYENAIAEVIGPTNGSHFRKWILDPEPAYSEMGKHDTAWKWPGRPGINGRISIAAVDARLLAREIGKARRSQAVADKMKTLSGQVYMSAYYQALVYTGLGDRDKAFYLS